MAIVNKTGNYYNIFKKRLCYNLSFGRLGQQQPQNQLQEQQRRRSTRQRTPRTSLTASSFSNSRQSYEIRVSKGKNKR